MKINRKLNLVVPIEDEATGLTNYVFAEPIGELVFERYFRLISRTFTDIMTDAGGMTAGPRTALLFLRDNARAMKIEDDVEQGLIAEIRRLANLLVAGPNGYELIPLEDAVKTNKLDPEDRRAVENALAFFTVSWAMFLPRDRPTLLASAMALWSGLITSSNITEFTNSLKTSKPDGNTGEKATPLSIPS